LLQLEPTPQNRIQGQLLRLAALCLGLYALSITLAPAARARTWQVTYPYLHWICYLGWVGIFWLAHRQTCRQLTERDPMLLPITGLLSGWGILTIARLDSSLGLRQAAWLLVSLGALILGLRLPQDLSFLRRYKYLWLTGGLVLTALTLAFGTNPLGVGPRLWLGCCGLYLQPSEPLKLLLVIYLSAYLADRQLYLLPLTVKGSLPAQRTGWSLLPLLLPSLGMTSLAVLLLLAQRDLGTATVFMFLYTAVIYIATGLLRFVLPSAATIGLAGVGGYLLFDVVRLRIDAWLNPWIDPSGRSFQIVQSLLAAANGGLIGRGPGMGSPGLVPVAHSDFIFVAIVEETGFLGAVILVGLYALLLNRGLRISLLAPSAFHRYLAAGLTAHLVGQTILIIGGNLRLLPLTGVTLPFVSYGGSSLFTSFLSLLVLMLISSQASVQPTSLPRRTPYVITSFFLSAGLAAALLMTGWWSIYRSPDLLTRTDNARRSIAERYVQRGTLRDRNNLPLAESIGATGNYERKVIDAGLGPVIGYNHPVYGQSGLEASLDTYLRGNFGYADWWIWWHNLLYGYPPEGLDVRLSLDLELQQKADLIMQDHQGALVLINAENGEILAMVSHPSFDPNQLDQQWSSLVNDPAAPFLNRATLGRYPLGATMGPMLLAAAYQSGSLPPLRDISAAGQSPVGGNCAQLPEEVTDWGQSLAGGCPAAVALLGETLGNERLYEIYSSIGLFSSFRMNLPTAAPSDPGAIVDARRGALGLAGYAPDETQAISVSPLQMALAAATLSNGGIRPIPHLTLAVELPQAGWTVLPVMETASAVFVRSAAERAHQELTDEMTQIWYSISTTSIENPNPDTTYAWFIGGTAATWQGSPLALAVLIEENNVNLVKEIGTAYLTSALQP